MCDPSVQSKVQNPSACLQIGVPSVGLVLVSPAPRFRLTFWGKDNGRRLKLSIYHLLIIALSLSLSPFLPRGPPTPPGP
ncbi:uncharacterized protein BDW43DRAFT_214882 [Aspergillus alliaceus]|uniref:uncharacterized protein n=1 Tax=Petromyces alliaceus TaxID=209559 RepID=UPI0012A76D08|nr:uncharacterized protein BDW43DRAFT_214882 [Aspergillus alliaceus]KAB8228592.1 hypothetical protein BDW43DRAFT_214882 [Aspergillus alliaceus]